MIYIKLPERLKNEAANRRSIITSDESWAFTEQPKSELSNRVDRMKAHDLFNLFTANIIKAKTSFIR